MKMKNSEPKPEISRRDAIKMITAGSAGLLGLFGSPS